MKIFAYACCLLSALTLVQMKTYNLHHRVGETVVFRCTWTFWANVKENAKYFCVSPCTEDKHILIRAEYGETKYKNNIRLTNNAEGLLVTFTNIQKSDARGYYCAGERPGIDAYIMIIIHIKDAESSSPKATPKTVIPQTTSPAVLSHGSDVSTERSASYATTTASATQATSHQHTGSLLYWIVGLIVTITLLTAVLMVIRRRMKKQQTVVTTPQEPAGESGAADGVYQSLQLNTMDEHQVYSTITPNIKNTVL